MRFLKIATTAFSFLTFLLVTPSIAEQASPRAYQRAEMLIEADELAAALAESRFVILDARSDENFRKSHIPGARWLDATVWKETFDDGTDVDAWSKRISELGITRESNVVVYDDYLLKDSSRVWFILRYFGVENVRLLNGGWHGWTTSRQPQERTTAAVTAVDFEPEIKPERLATKSSMMALVQRQNVDRQIIDTRTFDEFLGRDARTNRRAGAIPGAIHLEWDNVIDKSTHRFKSAQQLDAIFGASRIDLDQPIVNYCQTGRRASVAMFAMELMGANDVQNYYKSWLQWGNDSDTPVVKPVRLPIPQDGTPATEDGTPPTVVPQSSTAPRVVPSGNPSRPQRNFRIIRRR